MGSQPSLFLGIDTSTRWGSLGLIDSRGLVASVSFRSVRGHGKQILPRLRELLAETGSPAEDIAGIGVTVGPGSFTALRVGVSTAQGLGMGWGIPVVPVETPSAVVRSFPPSGGTVLVLIPARNGEVFAQAFRPEEKRVGWEPVGVLDCIRIEEVGDLPIEPDRIAGPAVEIYHEELESVFGETVVFGPRESSYIRGETVARIAMEALEKDATKEFPPDRVEIRYCRSHGALTIAERRELKRNAFS